MPFDPNVRTLDDVIAVAAGAGAPNGGIAIDTWHMGKLGIAPEELRRIPLEHLAWVELSDGQREDMPDPVDETINHRRLPGEGEFDVAAYVDGLPRHGLRRAVGGRGALRGAAQPAHGGDLQAGLRDDQRPVPGGGPVTQREERR